MGRPGRQPGEVGQVWFPPKQQRKGRALAKVWYTDHQGLDHLREASGASVSQAKRRLERRVADELESRSGGTGDLITPDTTVAVLARMWLEYKRTAPAKGKKGKPITPNSWATLRSTAEGRIVPGLGADLQIRHLTPNRLHLFRSKVTRDGGTTKAIDDVLNPMLDWAVLMGALPHNPMASQTTTRRSPTRGDDGDGIEIIPDELLGGWNAAVERFTRRHSGGGRQANPTLQELCRFLLSTGLRHGEAGALWWEDLDLDADVPIVTVRATLVEPRKGGYETLTRQSFPKSHAGVRTLPLLPEIAQMLRDRRKRTRYRRLDDPVFASENGGHLWLGTTRTRLRSALKKHAPEELQGVTFHTLRRTLGTKVAHSYGIEYARWWLGHGSTQVTEQWYVAPPTQAPDALDAVATLFGAPAS